MSSLNVVCFIHFYLSVIVWLVHCRSIHYNGMKYKISRNRDELSHMSKGLMNNQNQLVHYTERVHDYTNKVHLHNAWVIALTDSKTIKSRLLHLWMIFNCYLISWFQRGKIFLSTSINSCLGPLLLTLIPAWISNHCPIKCGMKLLISIAKLQWLHCWSLAMDMSNFISHCIMNVITWGRVNPS